MVVDVLYALLDPARRARDAGRNEHVVAAAASRRRPTPRGMLGRCAATGWVGMSAPASSCSRCVIAAIFGPCIAPYDPNLTEAVAAPTSGPSGALAGLRRPGARRAVAAAGRRADVDARRRSPSSASAVDVGTVLAIAAAWRAAARTTPSSSSGLDMLFAFPGILLAVLAAAVFGAGPDGAVLALSVAYTPYVARVLRGAALRSAASRTSPRWRCRARRATVDLPAAPACRTSCR